MALFGRPTEHDEHRAATWRDWLQRQHPLAIAVLVLGVLSLTHFGTLLIDAIAGAVAGAIALSRINSSSGRFDGRWLAWTGIVASILSLLIAVIWVYRWI